MEAPHTHYNAPARRRAHQLCLRWGPESGTSKTILFTLGCQSFMFLCCINVKYAASQRPSGGGSSGADSKRRDYKSHFSFCWMQKRGKLERDSSGRGGQMQTTSRCPAWPIVRKGGLSIRMVGEKAWLEKAARRLRCPSRLPLPSLPSS